MLTDRLNKVQAKNLKEFRPSLYCIRQTSFSHRHRMQIHLLSIYCFPESLSYSFPLRLKAQIYFFSWVFLERTDYQGWLLWFSLFQLISQNFLIKTDFILATTSSIKNLLPLFSPSKYQNSLGTDQTMKFS